MKKVTLTILVLTFSLAAFSQVFEVPKNYKLEKAEDYATYEKDVVACIDWLKKTPVNEQTAKRKEANLFLLKWLSGSPEVQIEVKPGIVTFMETSPELLMVFMGGWAKYSLTNQDFDNNIAGSKAGLESVIEFYTKNRDLIPKDKNIEKFIKLKDKGKLLDYVKKNA